VNIEVGKLSSQIVTLHRGDESSRDIATLDLLSNNKVDEFALIIHVYSLEYIFIQLAPSGLGMENGGLIFKLSERFTPFK